jgi:hypothetical protein
MLPLTAAAARLTTPHRPAFAGGLAQESDSLMQRYGKSALAEPSLTDAPHWQATSIYGLLDLHRPDIASLARFAHGVDVATFHMCVAFGEGGFGDFDHGATVVPNRLGKSKSWFAALAGATISRFAVLRRALMVDWTPPAELEPLTYWAFHSLCDLTPVAGHSLKILFRQERGSAIKNLVIQLDIVAKQLEDAAVLADDVEALVADTSVAEDATRLAANQDAVLSRAGEALTLTQAAKRLGMTRQNLHKRIGTGSALGVMRGKELIIPSVQIMEVNGAMQIVPDLRQVISLFEEAQAGIWAALQFLTETDPMLAAVPIERLKAGDVEMVVAAARANLGLDET